MNDDYPVSILMYQGIGMFLCLAGAVVMWRWNLERHFVPGKVCETLIIIVVCTLLNVGWRLFEPYGVQMAFLKGVRDRLDRDVDAKQLQSWALGVMPETPQVRGSAIRLPNGRVINSETNAGGEPNISEDGSFSLSPDYLPPDVRALFRTPPWTWVQFEPDRADRYIQIGNPRGRFGLMILIGSPKIYEYGHLLWRDGIYICINGGG